MNLAYRMMFHHIEMMKICLHNRIGVRQWYSIKNSTSTANIYGSVVIFGCFLLSLQYVSRPSVSQLLTNTLPLRTSQSVEPAWCVRIFSIIMYEVGWAIWIIDINNVGTISQLLYAHQNSEYDEAKASGWQAAQVSLLSLISFSGRFSIGK